MPKLGRPDNERGLEQAALLEVFDQRGDRLVAHHAVERQAFADAFVVVPRLVVDADEPHPALDHAPREQAVERVGLELVRTAATILLPIFRFAAVDAVGLDRRGRFVRDVDEVRRFRLHAPREFVRRYARKDFRIVDLLVVHVVQIADRIEAEPLAIVRQVAGVAEVEDGVALIA